MRRLYILLAVCLMGCTAKWTVYEPREQEGGTAWIATRRQTISSWGNAKFKDSAGNEASFDTALKIPEFPKLEFDT